MTGCTFAEDFDAMKRLLLVLLSLAATSARLDALATRVHDTLHVAVRAQVRPANLFPDMHMSFKSVKFELSILDRTMEYEREGKYILQQSEANTISGARSYLYWVNESFVDTGLVFIKRKFSGTGENGNHFAADDVWPVYVHFPTLATSMRVDPEYFYGEKNAILDFTMLELTNSRDYSYTITNELTHTVADSGRGSFINLESIVNNIEYSRPERGTRFHIKGMYNGRAFRFRNPVTNATDTTEWDFVVRHPDVQYWSAWGDTAQFRIEPERQLDLSQHYDWGPLEVRFVLESKKGDAWIYSALDPPELPQIREVGATGFLSKIQPFRRKKDPLWYIIELNPDPSFFGRHSSNEFEIAEFEILLPTQFGETRAFRFKARVY
jgi:hypothetical protein